MANNKERKLRVMANKEVNFFSAYKLIFFSGGVQILTGETMTHGSFHNVLLLPT